jgi:hypothetical protein
MEKIKSLLLPLALVFAAISIFEFGARYGATNMRAHAIASELQFPLSIYAQAEANMDPSSREIFSQLIDNGIAAGAMHRQVWYLDKKARAALDKVLTQALTIRGDAVNARFKAMDESSNQAYDGTSQFSKICNALADAKADLIDATPKPKEPLQN